MPTYITLIRYTREGVQNMKDSPNQLERAIEVTESYGGEYKGFYLTFGQYDGVYIAEYPDDESAAKAMLTVAGAGAVSTETLKAFTEDEYRDVIAGLAE
jgi:uncharacterized protein with GYD domain